MEINDKALDERVLRMGVSCYDPLLDYVQYRGPFALGGPALEVFDFHVAHGYLHLVCE